MTLSIYRITIANVFIHPVLIFLLQKKAFQELLFVGSAHARPQE